MCCRPLVRLNISRYSFYPRVCISSVVSAGETVSASAVFVSLCTWLYSTDAGIKSQRERSRAACVNRIDLSVKYPDFTVSEAGRADQ